MGIKFLNFLFYLTTFYLLLTTLPHSTFAQDYRNDYQVDYFLTENKDSLSTRVKFTVSVTNLLNDLYVKQFSVSFPKSFLIHNITASDDSGTIFPKLSEQNDMTKISLEFSNPETGSNSVNNFYLDFTQDNLFVVNGNVWEVIIPTIESSKNSSYKITVHLPQNSDKKISISKPKPSRIEGSTIYWENPGTKTVYAVFGDTQIYDSELTYNIKNTKFIPVSSDIAFPPDTLYQKIYIKDIKPAPELAYNDEDGNYLGRYLLKPKESKTITFIGSIEVFSKPREDLIPFMRKQLDSQKKYLFADQPFWNISQSLIPKTVTKDARSIYSYVVSTLQYNFDKINTSNTRLGATQVLNQPTNAVCMEFTDLFIALARKEGIFAREIEGYGYSQDPRLRPLSFVSDILHSWPEYYDLESDLWIPIDPTWEDTSGIDYFTGFDLNHIAFAIHGKKSDYPLPAGMYKIDESQDVTIKAVSDILDEKIDVTLEELSFPYRIHDKETRSARFKVLNNGNTYLWNFPLTLSGKNIAVSPRVIQLSQLAPYQKKEISIMYKASPVTKNTDGSITIKTKDGILTSVRISIVPYIYELVLKISAVLSVFIVVAFIIIQLAKRKFGRA